MIFIFPLFFATPPLSLMLRYFDDYYFQFIFSFTAIDAFHYSIIFPIFHVLFRRLYAF